MTLGVAACGSGEDPEASAPPAAASAGVQPPDGVPTGTFPLPLPEKGKLYNNPQPRDNVRDGGTLTLPLPDLGPNFNSFSADGSSTYVRDVMNWIAPRLWDYSVTGEPSPNPDYLVSAELLSDDPETVKYTLNPAAKWNDGTPIDWTAFETAWITQRGGDARYNPSTTAGYSAIESVRKGERDNEVVVTFKEPTYPYEYVFNFLPHPKNKDPELFTTGWVNDLHPELLAGPFTVESLMPGTLVLVRNPKWWGDPPKLERVIYREIEDHAAVNAFQNGEIDTTTVAGTRATADQLRQLSGMKDAQIRRGFGTGTSVYTMRKDTEFFQERAAREAFMLGTNRSLLVELRFQGMSWSEETPGSALIYPWQEGYRDNLADLHYDPERAKKVLDDAGWVLGSDGFRHKDGKTARFTYVTFGDEPTIVAMARAQQKMAQDIGLDMQIDVRKSSDFSTTITEGTFDVVAMGWTSTDPFGYVQGCQIFCEHSESNYSGVGSPEIDALLNGVSAIRDTAAAFAAFNEAESQAMHLMGTFPIYNGPAQFVVKKGLANFGPSGFFVPSAEDVGWQK
jgi:peptide/nickel transport system substrate-binding protein